uniref:Uncharacterized protein n=1 Tax=Rhizophora mucronata TaxID=61149 RepID=A0A2P2NZG9_RHIMU
MTSYMLHITYVVSSNTAHSHASREDCQPQLKLISK